MGDYKRRNINLDKLSSYVRRTGICTEEAALHLMDEIMFLRVELAELKPKLCDAQTLNEAQTYNAECAVELAQKYKDILDKIARVASGEDQVADDDTEGLIWIRRFIAESV